MKTNRRLVNNLFACAIAIAMASTLAAQTPVQGEARVVRIKGEARYSTSSQGWQPLHVGDRLKPGAVIQTSNEKGAYVDIVFGEKPGAGSSGASSTTTTMLSYQPNAEQNVVRVYSDTLLGVDKLTTMQTGADSVTESQLDLKAGHIFGSVKKMSAASKFEVKIPNGVAGIRGTTFEIWSRGLIKVNAGSVVMASVTADGKVITQVIMGGQEYDSATQELLNIPPQEKSGMDDAALETRTVLVNTTRTSVVAPDLSRLHRVSRHHPDHVDDDGDNDIGVGNGNDDDNDARPHP
jgi:hypothetical protein